MSKKTIMINVFIILFFVIFIFPFIFTAKLYIQRFGARSDLYQPLAFHLEDFPSLKRDKYEFISNHGQKLTGYNYYISRDVKGIVVLSHGIEAGGHNNYMNCAFFFAKNGYYVFAYDGTGNGESEGKSIKGLPQSVIDLDYAISFVEEQDEFRDLPIVLFGHSLGGYSVTNVLNYHPEIKSVVSLAGFNKSSDLVYYQGKQMIGSIINLLIYDVKLFELLTFGKYSVNTSINGFEKTDAHIMIIQSKDDIVVPPEYGYDIYYEQYQNSNQFNFLLCDGEHSLFYFSDAAIAYRKQFYNGLYKYREINHPSDDQVSEYIQKNLNREQWSNTLDENLFHQILDFYNNSLT